MSGTLPERMNRSQAACPTRSADKTYGHGCPEWAVGACSGGAELEVRWFLPSTDKHSAIPTHPLINGLGYNTRWVLRPATFTPRARETEQIRFAPLACRHTPYCPWDFQRGHITLLQINYLMLGSACLYYKQVGSRYPAPTAMNDEVFWGDSFVADFWNNTTSFWTPRAKNPAVNVHFFGWFLISMKMTDSLDSHLLVLASRKEGVNA